jgi:hypothetical protein
MESLCAHGVDGLPLISDESYQGPPESDFDNSRGAALVSFGQSMSMASVKPLADDIVEDASRDPMMLWNEATVNSGERPKDFGFLCGSVSEEHSESRSVSGTRSPDNTIMDEASNGSSSEFSRRRTRSPSCSTTSGSSKIRRTSNSDTVVHEASKALESIAQDNLEKPKKASFLKQDKTLMCKFYLKGRCLRQECNFAHTESEQREACKRIPCGFFARGGCRQGDDCWYLHDSTVAPQSREEDNKAEPPRPAEDNSGMQRNRIRRCDDGQKQDKTLLCTFWLKNRCTRGEGCKYAHGEAEQRAACKKIRCRFDKAGGCRQGDMCWYLHHAESQPSEQSTAASTPEKKPAVSPLESVMTTPSSLDARARIESWADFSDSDDEFVPQTHRLQGFPSFVTATA